MNKASQIVVANSESSSEDSLVLIFIQKFAQLAM